MPILISINILDSKLNLIDIIFFRHPSSGTGGNVIIFGVDMSSTTKIDNGKKDSLILVKGNTQRLEHTISTKKVYSITFNENNKNFCLSLDHNGANSY